MNTDFLAPYIWKNEEWLQMALHVYDAMPAVREHLIKAIFKAAGKRVAKELDVSSGRTTNMACASGPKRNRGRLESALRRALRRSVWRRGPMGNMIQMAT